jgi:hypothetical protein
MSADLYTWRSVRLTKALRPPVLVLVGTVGTFAALGASGFMPSAFGYTCPFKAITGLNCPGCGMSRAVHALAHGDVISALHFNALLLMVVPVLLYSWLAWFKSDRAGRPIPAPNLRLFAFVMALIVVFGIVRNIPGVPFIGSV